MKLAVQLLISAFVAGTLAVAPDAETVTLIPITVSRETSSQVTPPSGWPTNWPDDPDEGDDPTSSSTTSSKPPQPPVPPVKTTTSTTMHTTSKSTPTSTTSRFTPPQPPQPPPTPTTSTTSSEDGGISYTTCQGRRPCAPSSSSKTTSTKTTSSSSPPPVVTLPPLNCPIITATVSACKTCFVPGCTTVSTVTNSCGCPKTPVTASLNLGCNVRDACNLLGCTTLYRVASQAC